MFGSSSLAKLARKKIIPPTSPLAATGPQWGNPLPLRGPSTDFYPTGIIYSRVLGTAPVTRGHLVGLAGNLPVGYVSS